MSKEMEEICPFCRKPAIKKGIGEYHHFARLIGDEPILTRICSVEKEKSKIQKAIEKLEQAIAILKDARKE